MQNKKKWSSLWKFESWPCVDHFFKKTWWLNFDGFVRKFSCSSKFLRFQSSISGVNWMLLKKVLDCILISSFLGLERVGFSSIFFFWMLHCKASTPTLPSKKPKMQPSKCEWYFPRTQMNENSLDQLIKYILAYNNTALQKLSLYSRPTFSGVLKLSFFQSFWCMPKKS